MCYLILCGFRAHILIVKKKNWKKNRERNVFFNEFLIALTHFARLIYECVVYLSRQNKNISLERQCDVSRTIVVPPIYLHFYIHVYITCLFNMSAQISICLKFFCFLL